MEQTKIEALIDLLGEFAHEKAASQTMTAQRLHGSGGLFSSPGLERDVITAMVRPRGIGEVLPMIPSVIEDPRFGTITGITGPHGSQPANACGDAPIGYLKGCNLTARFGLKRFDTDTIEFDKVMLRANRGDHTDLVLRGQMIGMTGLGPNINQDQALEIITKAEMMKVGVLFERALANDLWQGTVAGGSFPGLDLQIATGHIDADTSTLCPAVDSDIKDFAYDAIGGTGRDIVEYLSMLEYYLNYNAESMGLDPVEFVVAVSPGMWQELSAVWPCAYMTNRCSNHAGSSVAVINDGANVTMRDQMRGGKYIDINGKRYNVVVDTGIYEHNSTNTAGLKRGEYASSIYMLPLTINGGFPVLYREYVDYSKAAGDVALLGGKEQFWTDGGAYSWAIEQVKWCYKLAAKTEQRVILRTPHLAGKIQHVKFSPLQHLRDVDPSSPYFMDGGVSMRSATFGAAVWR